MDTSASDPPHRDMATTLVLPPNLPPSQPQQQNGAGVNRRYRPAPAKTFQCRGYGDCRMVFSRSEHLARHIRKHTGERPFTCHCGKQFSRLDNLRQHAQTVHADKQDANERMMRELSSLHATMAAANKATQQRGKRGAQHPQPVTVSLSSDTISDASGDAPGAHPHLHQQQRQHQQNAGGGGNGPGGGGGGPGHGGVKQEDIQPALSLVSQRPGTSTGYEGDTDLLYHPHHHPSAPSGTWYVQDADRSHSRQASSHSFRAPGQSFRAPSVASPISPTSSTAPSATTPSSSPSTHQPHPGQSFLASGESFVELGVPDLPSSSWSTTTTTRTANADVRPSSSSSRPLTASRESADAHRSLPPLSAVVSSLPQSQWGTVPTQSTFPIPSGPGIVPARPSTATRPGTAPASYYSSHPFGSIGGGSGLVLSSSSAANPYGSSELVRSSSGYGSTSDATDSSVGGGYDSPFSFHPPALADQSLVPRKRPLHGIDDDDRERLGSSAGGSESRPQSRRLSVMELCNDTDADPTARPFLPLSAGQGAIPGTGSLSRPNTASTSLAALAIADPPFAYEQSYRHQSPVRAGFQQASATATGGGSIPGLASPSASSTGSGTSASTSPRGSSVASTSPRVAGRVYQQQQYQQRASVFGNVVPTTTVLRHGGAASASPPLRAVSGGPGVAASYASPGSSPGSNASAPRSYGTAESRRERAEQVRLAVSSPHAASALGMRV